MSRLCSFFRLSRPARVPSCTLLCLFLWVPAVLAAEPRPGDKPLRVLTIGNSFAENSTAFLREICQDRKAPLHLGTANIPGSSMERHVQALEAYLDNPHGTAGRPYLKWDSDKQPPRAYSLVEILKQEPWDIVTIQQFSGHSFKPETYEPHAATLVRTVQSHAPTAEILVHMTWAYRADHEWFSKGTLTRDSMYDGLRGAYLGLSNRYGLRILPVGAAFEHALRTPLWSFRHPDPDFNYSSPPAGAVPRQDGSLHTGWYWGRRARDPQPAFRLDATHANVAGQYLGALVFYAVLFDADPQEVAYKPDALNAEQASSLRRAAHQAVQEFASHNAGRQKSTSLPAAAR